MANLNPSWGTKNTVKYLGKHFTALRGEPVTVITKTKYEGRGEGRVYIIFSSSGRLVLTAKEAKEIAVTYHKNYSLVS